MTKLLLFYLSLFSFFWLLAPITNAAEKPEIELGFLAVEGYYPHYTGSNEYYMGAVLLPYGVIRDPYYEAGETNRFFIHNGDKLDLELGFFGRMPLWNEGKNAPAPAGIEDPDREFIHKKSWARRGMDHQPIIFQFGLKTTYLFNEHLYTILPFYHGRGLVIGAPSAGFNFTPSVRFDFFDRQSKHALVFSIGREYGDEKYNSEIYSVRAKDVLEGRPAYQARSGLIASEVALLASFEVHPKLDLIFTYLVTDMSDSELTDSPLVATTHNRLWVIGFMYKFLSSRKMVEIHK
ncbi:MAG: MipA/OmpV family protein [SAR324 cluster bacterium]|nr:MipA/OmpV family protein [SAR324 cluster bacterium]